jgi:hypothetical protein
MPDFVTPQNGTHPKQSNHMKERSYMDATTNENIAQAAYDRIADTERHLRHHGPALCNLFDAFDAPSGFDALCDLHGIFGNQHPDAKLIRTALQEIETFLAKQTSQAADAAARDRGFDASGALRWHGARISELHARFCNAD